MPSEIVSTSGLLLMLVLGLRHRLDPDHALTQAAVSRPRSLVKTSILRLSQLNGSMSARV